MDVAQAHVAGAFHLPEQVEIDRRAARRRVFARSMGPARLERLPQFLGDAVHVDGQADTAVADQSDPQFLVLHPGNLAHRLNIGNAWGQCLGAMPARMAIAFSFRSR